MDAVEWNARYSTSELVWSGEPNQFVAAETTDLPPGLALDLAAGEGRNAIWLARRGWRATAVDFSQVAIEKGENLAKSFKVSDRVSWICADLLSWEPPPSHFDLVVVAYLHLAHPDLESVLRRAAATLADGGTVVVVGHDLSNLSGGIGGPQDPELLYTPPAVSGMLVAGGLWVSKAVVVERQVGQSVAFDTLVVATRTPPETTPEGSVGEDRG